MTEKRAPVKEAIIEILRAKGEATKDEIAQEVAEKLRTQPRVVKAVITKMLKRGELVERNGKIALP